MTDERLAWTHPEMVRRYERLVERMWSRGWDIWIVSSTRSEEQQRQWYALYLQGRFPNIVADPDRFYCWAPREAGGFPAFGSMHMIQKDGWSHALDIAWLGPLPHQVHNEAAQCGLFFPEPTENWHMQFWDAYGMAPILDSEDDMTKEEYAEAIGARIATDGDHAGKIVVDLLETLNPENNTYTMKEYPLAQAIVLAHQEGKTWRLTH